MSDNEKDNRNVGGGLSKEKSNLGFEKKNVNVEEGSKKQQTPNEEVPNIGDREKRGTTVTPGQKSSKEDVNQKDEKEVGKVGSYDKSKLEEEKLHEKEAK